MILLLDSHALVWWLVDDTRLSAEARAAIADSQNEVLTSAATVWELAIKRSAGKLKLDLDLAAAVAAAGFSGVPVTMADAEAAASLPPHHRDPFDRMIVAQAQRLDAVIVSRDQELDAYDVRVLRA